MATRLIYSGLLATLLTTISILLPLNAAAAPSLNLTDEEQAWISQHPYLRIGIDPNWAPFEYYDEQGVYRGIAAEYMKLVSQRLSVTLVPQSPHLTWSDVVDKARRKEIDMLTAVRPSEERKIFLNFTETYIEFPMVVISRSSDQAINNLNQLEGKQVAVVNAYVTHDLIKEKHPEISLRLVNDVAEGLQAVSTGEVSAYIGNLASISHANQKLGLTNLRVDLKTPYSFPLSVGVKNDWPILTGIMNKALNSISKEEKQAIIQRWIDIETDTGIDPTTLAIFLLPIVAAILAYIIASTQKNKRLRKAYNDRDQLLSEHTAITNHIPDLLFKTNLQGELVWWNEITAIKVGLTEDNCLIPMESLFIPDDRQAIRNLFEQLNNTASYSIEVNMTSEDGPRLYQINSALLYEEKIPSGHIHVARDIHNERIIENALNDISLGTLEYIEEDYFDSLTQQLATTLGVKYAFVGKLNSEGSLSIDTYSAWGGNSIIDNFSYMLEHTPCSDVMNRKICVISDDVDIMYPLDEMLKEMNIKGYGGVPLKSSHGDPIGILVVMDEKPLMNIDYIQPLLSSFAIRASAELQRMIDNEKLRQAAAVYQHTIEGIMIADNTNRIIDVNDAFVQITGYSKSEVIGKDPSMLRSGRHDSEFYNALWDAVNKNGEWSGEIWNRRKNGEMLPAWMTISIIRDRLGNTVNYIGVFTDISERIEMETKQNKLHNQVLQSQKMDALGQLTGGVAHDFNNILASILGYNELSDFALRNKEYSKLPAYIDKIGSSGNRAKSLINQMLAFSKAKSSSTNDKSITALKEVINNSMDLLRPLIPSSIEFTISLEDSVPDLWLDVVQVEQIIMNLCINARDAIGKSGCISIRVNNDSIITGICDSCNIDFSGRYVSMTVQDTGSGFDATIINRVFEPFMTTKRGEGSGMGLSMVHGIMHAHDGHLQIANSSSGGAIVQCYFPMPNHTLLEPDAGIDKPPKQQASSDDSTYFNIMIIDDEPDIVSYLEELLTDRGYCVSPYTDGKMALNDFALNASKYHLIISDQTMPKLTGDDFICRAHAIRDDIPVILCSGYSHVMSKQEAHEIGAFDFLKKPFDSADLLNSVKTALYNGK